MKINDKVIVTVAHDNVKKGWVGVIKGLSKNSTNLSVEFKNRFDGGHSCDGTCKTYCGHWIPVKKLRVVKKGEKVPAPVVKHVITKDSCDNFEKFTDSYDEAVYYLENMGIIESYTISKMIPVANVSRVLKIKKLKVRKVKKR